MGGAWCGGDPPWGRGRAGGRRAAVRTCLAAITPHPPRPRPRWAPGRSPGLPPWPGPAGRAHLGRGAPAAASCCAAPATPQPARVCCGPRTCGTCWWTTRAACSTATCPRWPAPTGSACCWRWPAAAPGTRAPSPRPARARARPPALGWLTSARPRQPSVCAPGLPLRARALRAPGLGLPQQAAPALGAAFQRRFGTDIVRRLRPPPELDALARGHGVRRRRVPGLPAGPTHAPPAGP